MDPKHFMKFRMSLLLASGFQSAQYRMIEICSTSLMYLVDKDHREKMPKKKVITEADILEMYSKIYWKQGATELSSGKKTLTLTQFEEKYDHELVELAENHLKSNLWATSKSLPK